MKFYSSEFADQTTLDASYQVDRDNQSPALTWQDVPDLTLSFAITMHDPDAPTGGAGWWHWMVYDIAASIRQLPRNAGAEKNYLLPAGAIQMFNDGRKRAYMGCYPPLGDPAHRYIFTLYALDCEKLEINTDVSTSNAGFIINSHAISKATLTALYARF